MGLTHLQLIWIVKDKHDDFLHPVQLPQPLSESYFNATQIPSDENPSEAATIPWLYSVWLNQSEPFDKNISLKSLHPAECRTIARLSIVVEKNFLSFLLKIDFFSFTECYSLSVWTKLQYWFYSTASPDLLLCVYKGRINKTSRLPHFMPHTLLLHSVPNVGMTLHLGRSHVCSWYWP